MACGTLTANFTIDCADPLVGGNEETLTLINFADWQEATVTEGGTYSQELVAITLATGKFAYKVEGFRNTVRTMYDSSVENGLTRYKHVVNFQIAGDDGLAKSLIEKLGLGTYVAITFTKSGKVEVFGAGTGLVIQGQTTSDRYANNGNATIQLASDDESLEVTIPKNYIGTSSPYSFADAKADIQALWAA